MRSKENFHSLPLVSISLVLFMALVLFTASATSAAAENLTVHFIDVGQGDSILVQYGDKDMLIDAGERGTGDDVAEYIKRKGVTSLDYVVATHPHADHIGGMSDILKTFPIGQFLDSGYPHTSGTYEYMLETIDSNNIPFTTVKRGDKIDFASGIVVEVLNPGSSYFTDDLNQNSVVLKITDGSVSFLLMGDAGIEAEGAIVKDGYNVDADILKVGHHGSITSSGKTFISAVSPAVSIIEVGTGNKYGHPHAEVLETLQKASTVYRTDVDGTVTVTTDGSAYTLTTEKTAVTDYTEISETPTQTPTETSAETPTQTPAETPTQTPTETPTQIPTETPTQTLTETSTQTSTEMPAEETDDTGSSSSGGRSHRSSSGGGSTGGSPEPQKNVEFKDTAQVFIPNEKPVYFNFTNNVTVVDYISFTSKRTVGKTTAIVENLKNRSESVSDSPEGVVYKFFNVWVGNGGYGDSDKILNATISFKVQKSWIQENDIDPSSIVLHKHDDKKKEWIKLPVSLAIEDDQFLHFIANVPGYSFFVITGTKDELNATAIDAQAAITSNESDNASNITSNADKPKLPGFGIIGGIICLLCILLYRIKER
ncbi:MAG TPA: PGF-pre-PGF domain-containing protein [Methanosarcina sp.]|nr:PGF-pre-PGF domain-containing protein [Methanosarcina sp.]